MIAFFNNEFIEEEKASLGISDLSIQRGYGVFDFLRTKNFVPLFIDDYLNRFFNSISLMFLDTNYSKQELKNIIRDLITRNNIPDSGVKLLLTGGYSADGYQPAKPNLIITQPNLQLTSSQKFAGGIKIITCEYQRELPEAKSINYLMGVWLQKKVKEQQAADVLYYQNGFITEFPRSNVFIVTRDKKLITPSQNILYGITRKKILEIASAEYEVETRPVHIDELKDAAEVFTTSTTKKILPIKQVDNIIIGDARPGPVSISLNDAFSKMEDEYIIGFQW